MITRTFISYKVTATVVDKQTHDVKQEIVTIPMSSFNKKKKNETVAKNLPENAVLVSIDSIEEVKDLRGITEECFLANSVPVTRPASQQ